MRATSQALRGYAKNAAPTRSNRRAEYEVIGRVTQEMRDCAMKQKDDFPAFVSALHNNQRLWTALVVDIMDERNPIPNELKARIVYLAEFTNHHSRQVLKKKASILPLLEINMAVLRGLKKEGSAA